VNAATWVLHVQHAGHHALVDHRHGQLRAHDELRRVGVVVTTVQAHVGHQERFSVARHPSRDALRADLQPDPVHDLLDLWHRARHDHYVVPVHKENVDHEVVERFSDDARRAVQELLGGEDAGGPAPHVGEELEAHGPLVLDLEIVMRVCGVAHGVPQPSFLAPRPGRRSATV
jgi:hypothetical protein